MSEIKSFKLHCEKPYLRHDYKVFFVDGKSIVFDNYEDVQLTWFQSPSTMLSHVEVLDHKEPRKKTKGF